MTDGFRTEHHVEDQGCRPLAVSWVLHIFSFHESGGTAIVSMQAIYGASTRHVITHCCTSVFDSDREVF